MNTVLLGNIFAFAGSILMIATGLIKRKKHILLAQCLQFTLMGVGNIVLGGYSGAVANGVSILRNVVCLFLPFTLPWQLGFIALQGVLSLVFSEGIVGILPFFAACVFTLSLSSKDERMLKGAMMVGQMAWLVYDLTIHNYAGMVFDVLTVISNAVGIVMLVREKREAESADRAEDKSGKARDGKNS